MSLSPAATADGESDARCASLGMDRSQPATPVDGGAVKCGGRCGPAVVCCCHRCIMMKGSASM